MGEALVSRSPVTYFSFVFIFMHYAIKYKCNIKYSFKAANLEWKLALD